jgi:hypothetical protein
MKRFGFVIRNKKEIPVNYYFNGNKIYCKDFYTKKEFITTVDKLQYNKFIYKSLFQLKSKETVTKSS